MVRPAVVGALVVVLLMSPQCVARAEGPSAPGQPEAGPGGTEYPHGSFERSRFGSGAAEYWVYTPDDPRPKSAPVIVFNHGWSAMHPYVYGAWLQHLARRGNIVIYPRYQVSARTPARSFTANAAEAVKDALVRLRRMGPVSPELSKLAIVGHSAGGVISANMAGTWRDLGTPKPLAVMCVAPARSLYHDSVWGVPVADYSAIETGTLLLCLVGADDRLAGSEMAEQIITEASQVPDVDKDLVVAVSDNHGSPALLADHGFATARLGSSASVNALDYYACWKLLDGLTDAAFFGKNREYALGDTPQQRHMGEWSDGAPVKELVVRKAGDAGKG
jgi:acetyl esterase/lipase